MLSRNLYTDLYFCICPFVSRQWNKVYPLSLLAFVATAHALSLPRNQRNVSQEPRAPNPSQMSGINHLFRRHVKPKKQHEVKLLGEVCQRVNDYYTLILFPDFFMLQVIFALSQSTNCKNIIVSSHGDPVTHTCVWSSLYTIIFSVGHWIWAGMVQLDSSSSFTSDHFSLLSFKQGHLARYLAFHYGLNVTTVEAIGCHLLAAAKFDRCKKFLCS